jgi:hypothetical protein
MQLMILIISWLAVAVPLGWGVQQSVRKASPLFESVPDATQR